jgi:hypothetical protein
VRIFRFGRWWDCWPQVPAWVPGGRWIPYGPAAVALHRAARLVCVALPLGGVAGPSTPPVVAAPSVVGWPVGSPGIYLPGSEGLFSDQLAGSLFVPGSVPEMLAGFEVPVATPAPGSLTLVLIGAGALIAIKRKRTSGHA